MSYHCNVCDKTMKLESKIEHFIFLTHKEFDKCKHKKLSKKNPD